MVSSPRPALLVSLVLLATLVLLTIAQVSAKKAHGQKDQQDLQHGKKSQRVQQGKQKSHPGSFEKKTKGQKQGGGSQFPPNPSASKQGGKKSGKQGAKKGPQGSSKQHQPQQGQKKRQQQSGLHAGYECNECDIGSYESCPVMSGICYCPDYTEEDAKMAYATMCAATYIVAGYVNCGCSFTYECAEYVVYNTMQQCGVDTSCCVGMWEGLCDECTWNYFVDAYYENFNEACDTCDLDCESCYWAFYEVWPVLYEPCQCSGTNPSPPPSDCCDDICPPEALYQLCEYYFEDCAPEWEMTAAWHSYEAQMCYETYGNCPSADYPYEVLREACCAVYDVSYDAQDYECTVAMCYDLYYNEAYAWGYFWGKVGELLNENCGGYGDCECVEQIVDNWTYWFGDSPCPCCYEYE